jgi:hypothetical protein
MTRYKRTVFLSFQLPALLHLVKIFFANPVTCACKAMMVKAHLATPGINRSCTKHIVTSPPNEQLERCLPDIGPAAEHGNAQLPGSKASQSSVCELGHSVFLSIATKRIVLLTAQVPK